MNKLKKKICNVQELSKKKVIKKWISEWKDEVIILKYKEKIYIKSAICPHFGGPLDFDNEKKYLQCYWHGLKFSVENGKCLNQKTFIACLSNYNYELVDSDLYIIKNENT